MKTQRLKHFSIYLRTSLRRIKAYPFLLIMLMFTAAEIGALDIACVLKSDASLVCSINAEPFKTRNILDAMNLGHRTQIDYYIRVYENKSRFLGLFGDRLIHDISVSYIATRDPFGDKFYITKPDGKKITSNDADTFFNKFFSMNELNIDMKKAGKGEYYILGKIEVKIIKLMPPLNLLSNLIPGIVEKTDWVSAGSFRIR